LRGIHPGPITGGYDAVTSCWKSGAPKVGASVPPASTEPPGSIELGIFDEPERVRSKVSQAGSPVRRARSSWPLSARLLVGAMFVSNSLLAAFLVRTEIKRPGAPAISTPLIHRPNASYPPQLHAPSDQASSLDQGSGRSLKRTPPVEASSAVLPSARMAKRPKTNALRASKTPRAVFAAPTPRAVTYASVEPPGRTSAPVRNPAVSSISSANVPPRGGLPGTGVPSNAGTSPKAPAASALAPSAIEGGLTAKGTGSVAKVASVGLPAMEKGSVMAKMPVAPVSPKIEIVPRPAVKHENCGDANSFVACPTLKIRYDTPYSSEGP